MFSIGNWLNTSESRRQTIAAEPKEKGSSGIGVLGLTQGCIRNIRPVDSTQYLYESYVTSADSAAVKARHFDRLAAEHDQHDGPLATSHEGKL
jgi:hypothetical protein